MHLGIKGLSVLGSGFRGLALDSGDGCLGTDGHKPVFSIVIKITVIKINIERLPYLKIATKKNCFLSHSEEDIVNTVPRNSIWVGIN